MTTTDAPPTHTPRPASPDRGRCRRFDAAVWRMALGPGFATGPGAPLVDYLGTRARRPC